MDNRIDRLTEKAVAKLRAAVKRSLRSTAHIERTVGLEENSLPAILETPLVMGLRAFVGIADCLELKILDIYDDNGDPLRHLRDEAEMDEVMIDPGLTPEMIDKTVTTALRPIARWLQGVVRPWPHVPPELQALLQALMAAEQWVHTGDTRRREAYDELLRAALERLEPPDEPPAGSSAN